MGEPLLKKKKKPDQPRKGKKGQGAAQASSTPAAGTAAAATGSSKSSSYSSVKCHEGNIHVVTITRTGKEDLEIWAGGHSRSGGWDRHEVPPDVVVAPASVTDPVGAPPGWRASRHFPAMFLLQWPDFGVPAVADDFWPDLAQDLLDRDEVRKVQVECQGGHGRTGTALALLVHYLIRRWATVDDIVEYVREHYCDECVEARAQFEYIAGVTGLSWEKRVQPPTKGYSYGGNYGGNYGSSWSGSSWKGGSYKSSYYGDDDLPDYDDVKGTWIEGYWSYVNDCWICGHWSKDPQEKIRTLPFNPKTNQKGPSELTTVPVGTPRDADPYDGLEDEETTADGFTFSEIEALCQEVGFDLYKSDGRYIVSVGAEWEESFGTLDEVVHYLGDSVAD